MVIKKITYLPEFKKEFHKLDKSLKIQVEKRIIKIIENPEIGKPLRYNLKGEREVYVRQFRLIYSLREDELILLKFRHKDEAGES